jgi:predicted nuclease with TOPRIM domain
LLRQAGLSSQVGLNADGDGEGGKKMSETKILLGFEVSNGKEVYMKLHHTVVTGMTQLSGKTTALEAIIQRSKLWAIAFKTKRGEAGFSSYNEIQPFFIEQADWRYVSSLLEAMLRERMKFERSWIIKATKGTKTLREVYENVKSLREKARKDSLTESVYVTLEEYLSGIIPQIEKFNFVKELNLANGINVMDLSAMTLEMRSLVIRSVMENVIDHMSNIVVIIPEAWEYLPQGRATPVKLYAETFIRKGASVGNYLFVDSQDIAGIDKTPLRSCDNWIMGRQKETHEVERFREVVGKSISEEEIKSLPIGHFIAYLGNEIRKVYVLPAGVPEEVGRRVALGELTSEYVRDNFLKKKEVEDEMAWKEKCGELERSNEALREENEKMRSAMYERDEKLETREQVEKELKILKEGWEKNTLAIAEAERTIKVLKEQLKDFEALREALSKILPTPPNIPDKMNMPSEISVTTEQPIISVKAERKQLVASDKDLLGKMALIYADGDLGAEWFTVSDVTRLFERHAWSRDPRTSGVLDQFVQWGFLEKRYSGKRPEYKVKLTPAEAKSKGLLRVEE